MIQDVLERRYRRLGSRYLVRTLLLQQQFVHALIFGSVGLLSLYVEMSVPELLRLALAGSGLQLVYSLVALSVNRRLARPITVWIEGQRNEQATVDAWQAAASLPFRVLMAGLGRPPLGPLLWSFFLMWSMYAAWELELAAYSAALIYVSAVVLVSYGAALRFFGTERIVRPAVEDIARALPDGAGPAAEGLSLRVRLLVEMTCAHHSEDSSNRRQLPSLRPAAQIRPEWARGRSTVSRCGR